MQNYKIIGHCKSPTAAICEWSPDNRKFMTAVLTPRLRVDNHMKIFSYDGQLLMKRDYQSTELYEVQWIYNID